MINRTILLYNGLCCASLAKTKENGSLKSQTDNRTAGRNANGTNACPETRQSLDVSTSRLVYTFQKVYLFT